MSLINKKILEALKDIKVPVSFQRYDGKKDDYITFHIYAVNGEKYEDDLETLVGYYL